MIKRKPRKTEAMGVRGEFCLPNIFSNEIVDEEQASFKPWIRAVAFALVFFIFFQSAAFAAGPDLDLESAANLKLKNYAPQTNRPLLFSAVGNIFKSLFIGEAYAENTEPAIKSAPAPSASNSTAAPDKNYTSPASAVRFGGEKFSYTTTNNVNNTGYQYKTQPISPTAPYFSNSWMKTTSASGQTYISSQINTGLKTQPASGQKYYLEVRPALPKVEAEAAVVRNNVSKASPLASPVSTGAKFMPEVSFVKLSEQNKFSTVMISKGALATREEVKFQANLVFKTKANVEITRSLLAARNNNIDFAGASANKFYKLPAVTPIKVFDYKHNQIDKRLSAAEKVFVSLPNAMFKQNTLTAYAGLGQENLMVAVAQNEGSKKSASALETRQPLLPPVAPVSIPQPPAANSGPGGNSGPDTGAASAQTQTTTGASSINTGGIQHPYGPPPLVIALPGFPVAGSYEIILSTLSQLYSIELASVRGDGGVMLPSSGLLPSPEAGRIREGEDFITSSHPQKGEFFAFCALAARNYIGNSVITTLLTAKPAANPVKFNNYISHYISQENIPAGVEPFRRAPQLNLPAEVNSGNIAPAFGFSVEKLNAGVLPQSLGNILAVQAQNYIGIR
jgi:hypothetical protein